MKVGEEDLPLNPVVSTAVRDNERQKSGNVKDSQGNQKKINDSVFEKVRGSDVDNSDNVPGEVDDVSSVRRESVAHDVVAPVVAPEKQRIILKKNKIRFREDVDGDWKEGTILQRAGKVTGKYDGYFNIQMNNESRDVKVINMYDLPDWSKVDTFSTMQDEESAFLVMVPK